jgi:hypothetical protein
MKSRLSLGLSNVCANEFHRSPWEKIRKIGLIVIVCVLLAICFAYLTEHAQIGTAQTSGSNVGWDSTY